MFTNYWIEQHNKEVLAQEIKKYLDDMYQSTYDASLITEISKEITQYLIRHNKTQHKVFVRLGIYTGDLLIEIP